MRYGEEIGLFTSSVMRAVWAKDEYFTHHTRRKSNLDRLLHIIFFITQIFKVLCLCKRGDIEAKALEKKNLYKNFEKKNVQQKYS